MKAILILVLLAAGSLASAAIEVRCTVAEEGEDIGYSSYAVEKSLPDGHQTGSFEFGPVKDQKITVNIHNNGTKGIVGSICAEVVLPPPRPVTDEKGKCESAAQYVPTSSTICSADGAKLEIRSAYEKTTVSCKVN